LLNQGKILSAQLENTLSKLPGPTVAPVRVMAEAQNDLLRAVKVKKSGGSKLRQLPLFQ
jgi:hypothetical protein